MFVALPPLCAETHVYLRLLTACPVQIGNGAEDYEAAKRLLQRWAQFQLGWALVDAATGTTCGWPVVVQAQPVPWVPIWVACPLQIAYAPRPAVTCALRRLLVATTEHAAQRAHTTDVASVEQQGLASASEHARYPPRRKGR